MNEGRGAPQHHQQDHSTQQRRGHGIWKYTPVEYGAGGVDFMPGPRA